MRLCEQSGWERLWLVCAIAMLSCTWATRVCRADEFADWAGSNENLLADVPIVRECSHVLVDIKCFGGVHKFALDTGATNTVFDSSLRPKLGNPVGTASVHNSLADVEAEVFLGPKLLVGEFRMQSKYAGSFDLRHLGELMGYPLAGVIGLDALERCVVEFDQAGGRVRLFRSVPADVVRDSECLRMSRDEGGWSIVAHLPDGSSERFQLDTGGQSAVHLSDTIFERLRAADEIRKCQEICLGTLTGGTNTRVEGTLRDFRVGSFKHKGVTALSYPKSQIGMGYLRRYKAVFDFTGRRVYLRPSKEFNAPERPSDKSGLVLIVRDGQLLVRGWWDNSPAEEAGFEGGDRILRVNGRPAEELSLFKVYELLTREGECVQIEIARGDEIFSRKLTLREFKRPAPSLDTHEN